MSHRLDTPPWDRWELGWVISRLATGYIKPWGGSERHALPDDELSYTDALTGLARFCPAAFLLSDGGRCQLLHSSITPYDGGRCQLLHSSITLYDGGRCQLLHSSSITLYDGGRCHFLHLSITLSDGGRWTLYSTVHTFRLWTSPITSHHGLIVTQHFNIWSPIIMDIYWSLYIVNEQLHDKLWINKLVYITLAIFITYPTNEPGRSTHTYTYCVIWHNPSNGCRDLRI
jgi:hypothetical protein